MKIRDLTHEEIVAVYEEVVPRTVLFGNAQLLLISELLRAMTNKLLEVNDLEFKE